jgi:hypothetical protein
LVAALLDVAHLAVVLMGFLAGLFDLAGNIGFQKIAFRAVVVHFMILQVRKPKQAMGLNFQTNSREYPRMRRMVSLSFSMVVFS